MEACIHIVEAKSLFAHRLCIYFFPQSDIYALHHRILSVLYLAPLFAIVLIILYTVQSKYESLKVNLGVLGGTWVIKQLL